MHIHVHKCKRSERINVKRNIKKNIDNKTKNKHYGNAKNSQSHTLSPCKNETAKQHKNEENKNYIKFNRIRRNKLITSPQRTAIFDILFFLLPSVYFTYILLSPVPSHAHTVESNNRTYNLYTAVGSSAHCVYNSSREEEKIIQTPTTTTPVYFTHRKCNCFFSCFRFECVVLFLSSLFACFD